MSRLTISPLRIMLGVGATLLVTLLSLYLAFQRFSALKTANAWNVHTYQVLLETSHMLRGLLNIQTSARGFIQTGDAEFLEPLYAGRQEFVEHHKTALNLTRDNPDQQRRLNLLNRQYAIWMNSHIEPLVKMRRSTTNTDVAVQRARTGIQRRKIVMDAMRQTLTQLEKTERDLLAQRARSEQTQQQLAQLTLLLNGLFAVVLAAGLSAFLSAKSQRLNLINKRLGEQIKRREKAERNAKALNHHNEMILQASQDGLIGVNQAGKITFFNPAAEDITGWAVNEALGKRMHDLLHSKRPDGSPYAFEDCPIMETLRTGTKHFSSNESFWRKDGTAVPVELTAVPLWTDHDPEWEGEAGRQVGAVVFFRDITERKKSAAALQELAAIVRYSDDAIISIDLRGVITNWNRAATKLYGYTEWESIGQYMDRLLPPDAPDELPGMLKKIKNEEPVERTETVHLRKDGVPVGVILSLSPIKDEEGEVIGVACIARETYRSHMQRMAATEMSQQDGAKAS